MSDPLNSLVAAVLGLDVGQISDSARPREPEQWDSLNNIEIVIAIENEFGVQIELDEAAGARSVGEWRSYLKDRGAL